MTDGNARGPGDRWVERILAWRLPPIETYPRVVAFVQTPWGKLLLFAVFALILKALVQLSLLMTVAAAVVSMAGRHRFLAALAATAALLVHDPYWFGSGGLDQLILADEGLSHVDNRYLRAGTLILCVLLAVGALWLARRFRDLAFGRRPVLVQHLVVVGLLALASSRLLHGLPQVVLWSLVIASLAYFWYLAWALMGQREKSPPALHAHLATFYPFFAPQMMVPIGKGAADWARVEASSNEELAVTQLKGLKLVGWAFVLRAMHWAMSRVVFISWGVPTLQASFGEFLATGERPPPIAIWGILANFPDQLFTMAFLGHAMVATARLAGFRMLRNTYRPLRSRSIAEFWNRYFYYFKELMVHVYFYPTYIRWFKSYPRLRLAFATFMAAGVGNFFFHWILEEDNLYVNGLTGTAIGLQSYAFYCVVLSAGIVVSQLRGRRFDPKSSWWRRQLLPSLTVAAFFCFLSFFDGTLTWDASLSQHFAFLIQVTGIDTWIRTTG